MIKTCVREDLWSDSKGNLSGYDLVVLNAAAHEAIRVKCACFKAYCKLLSCSCTALISPCLDFMLMESLGETQLSLRNG